MYYLFDSLPGPIRWIGEDLQSDYWQEHNIWWNDGVPFRDGLIPEPLSFKLQPIKGTWDHGPDMPAYILGAKMPIFTDDLIAAMHDAGVDNLDIYQTELIAPESDEVYMNYKAINIIGLIAAADMEKSKTIVHDKSQPNDISFDQLVVDEKKTSGALMFRLAESNSSILVHEKLMNYLDEHGFEKELDYHDLGEAAIL